MNRAGGDAAREVIRQARIERSTKETQIVLQLDVDGTGLCKVETGIPFFTHMLEAWTKHGLMDLTVDAKSWLNTKDQKALKLDDLKGKVVLIDFWGVW